MSSFTLPCPNAVAGSASCRAPPRGRPCAARAAAKEAPPAAPGGPTLPTFYDPKTSTSWHFVLANADFMLNDENSEHLPEVLRERRRFFIENSAPSNFFVVPNPAWLAQQPQLATRVRQPAVAIVSPDAVWIRYLKLRLDRVLIGELQGPVGEVTASTGPVPPFPQPASWAAPYSKYAPGWWSMFEWKE